MPAISKIEKTVVEFTDQIFNGSNIEIEGTGTVVFRVFYPSKPFDKLNIEVERDGEHQVYTLDPGDLFNMRHVFNVKITKDIRDKHVFPVKISFNGQKYFLKKTKHNKLILTK